MNQYRAPYQVPSPWYRRQSTVDQVLATAAAVTAILLATAAAILG